MAILMPGRKLRNLPMRLVKPWDVVPLSAAPAFRVVPSSGQQPFDTLRRDGPWVGFGCPS